MQLGLGWGFSRAHENNFVLILEQWELLIKNAVARFYPGTPLHRKKNTRQAEELDSIDQHV